MKTIITLDKANQPYGFPQLNGNGNFNSIIVESGLTANTLVLTALTQSLTDENVLSIDNLGVVHTYPLSGLTGGTSASGDYLPLSGGTVTGNTYFTSGLSANTLYVTGLTQTSGITSTGGIIFPEKNTTSPYTATTNDYTIVISAGTYSVTLPTAVGVKGKLYTIKNRGTGVVDVIPSVGELIDDRTYVVLSQGNSVQLVSDGINWILLGYNISSTQTNTGVISFSGLSKASNTTFYVGPLKGFVVDDTTNPVIPFLTYVEFTGGTYTDNYVNTDFETFVYITSGGTIQQQPTILTEQQRRQNIFLGKIGHPEKVSINLVFNQPDYILTPLSQLRDMFVPINLINGGVYPSANGANLNFNTSAGYLYGLGINFVTSPLTPNAIYLSGTSPCTFQYRTQTGGTVVNTTTIDVNHYDVGGVITPTTGVKATNQRIFLLQNGTFRVQYGQTEYSNLPAAIEGIQTEIYTTFPNFINNAVLIGILSVASNATVLNDTSKARFLFASKFGETVGTAGGVSTTTLQQAYNNSSSPEILINSTLDGLTIQNGTGNADNVSNLLEGKNTAGTTTSFMRADGLISGSTLSTPGFTANTNGLTATTVSASTVSTPGFTANTNGLTATTVSATTLLTLSTTINSVGLTATTISATTYQNLPSQSGTGVSSFGYNQSTGILTITKNDTNTLTAGTFSYITAVTESANVINITSNGGSPSTYTMDAVTGGSYSNGTITLSGTGNFAASITGFNTGTVTGSGTSGYLSKFTSTTAIGDSGFYDNGSGTFGSYGTSGGPSNAFVAVRSLAAVTTNYTGGSVGSYVRVGFNSPYTGNSTGVIEVRSVGGISSSPLSLNYQGGNVIIGSLTDGGYKLDVNGTTRITNTLTVTATTDPVKFVGLQSASDTSVLTVDGTGVVHTIAASSLGGGGLTWNNATSSITASTNNGYVATATTPTLTTITLPTGATFGSIIEVVGTGTGLWRISQSTATQSIKFGITGTTTGTGGYLSATSQYDCVKLLCTSANTTFVVTSAIGNIFYN